MSADELKDYEDLSRAEKARDLLYSYTSVYREIGFSIRRFGLMYMLPTVLLAAGLFIYSLLMTSGAVAMILQLTAIAFPMLVLLYPMYITSAKSNEIDEKFHLFITHLTTLSLTNTSRIEIFRAIAEEEDYGALAEEIGRLVALVDTWNMSLDDACRVRARKTHSDVLADMYEQVAYNVGSGQSIRDFLVNEQSAFIKKYAATYEANIRRVEFASDLYNAVMQVTSFLVIFTLLMPFLTGMEPVLLVGGVLFMTVVLQTMFIFVVETQSPEDYLWYTPVAISTPEQTRIKHMSIGAIAMTVVLGLLFGLDHLNMFPWVPEDIPMFLYPAIPTLPLLVPGLYVRFVEGRLVRIEGQFAAFIRALGAIESVKKTSTSNVLRTLKNKDFGRLTYHIRHLFRRLNIGIDDTVAWRYFSAGIGSFLIKSFTDMYVVGRNLGGNPETMGVIISENFTEVMNLREKRNQAMGAITAQTHGMTIVSAITFFIGYEIMNQMVAVTEGVEFPSQAAGAIINPHVYDMPILLGLIFIALLLNSLQSALLVKRADRRHIAGSMFHFVLLVWASCLGGLAVHNFFVNFTLM